MKVEWYKELHHNWKKHLLAFSWFEEKYAGDTSRYLPEILLKGIYIAFFNDSGMGIRKYMDEFQATEASVYKLQQITFFRFGFYPMNAEPLKELQNLNYLHLAVREFSNTIFLNHTKLEKLWLNGPFKELKGINQLKNLKSLQISSSEIERIDDLSGLHIEELILSNCRKLIDLNSLKTCSQLRFLDLKNIYSLPDISELSTISVIEARFKMFRSNERNDWIFPGPESRTNYTFSFNEHYATQNSSDPIVKANYFSFIKSQLYTITVVDFYNWRIEKKKNKEFYEEFYERSTSLSELQFSLKLNLLRLKNRPSCKLDHLNLIERISLIEIQHDPEFTNEIKRILFNYHIFPEKIMVSLCQWILENREIKIDDIIVQKVFFPARKLFSLKMNYGVKITEIIHEPERIGFSYITLEGHAEKGISTFTVERLSDKMIFKIHTFSAPGNLISRIFQFITIPYQSWCTRQALENVRKQIENKIIS